MPVSSHIYVCLCISYVGSRFSNYTLMLTDTSTPFLSKNVPKRNSNNDGKSYNNVI